MTITNLSSWVFDYHLLNLFDFSIYFLTTFSNQRTLKCLLCRRRIPVFQFKWLWGLCTIKVLVLFSIPTREELLPLLTMASPLIDCQPLNKRQDVCMKITTIFHNRKIVALLPFYQKTTKILYNQSMNHNLLFWIELISP